MTRSFRMLALLAACVATAALIAAGCGSPAKQKAVAKTSCGAGCITVNWGSEPPSLDPGLATDVGSSNILLNIMDPLVRLDDELKPVPSLAESWDVSADGKTVTFHLRGDGRWTNGDPVTADDFVYSWKRTLAPELGADYAYQLYGIVGAAEYNGCTKNCAGLADEIGVKALDARTLEVALTSPQPWFLSQVAHHSFLAVNRGAVEQFGDKWTEAENIVTNGPFKIERWQHKKALDLVKSDGYRDAGAVRLERVKGRMIEDQSTAVLAFKRGELDVQLGVASAEIDRLKKTPDYEQYPGLGTFYYGINVKNISDPKQRQAMALVIDRQAIIDNIGKADQIPATGFSPQGIAGFDALNPDSPYLPARGSVKEAKALMAQVAKPKTKITLYTNSEGDNPKIAVAIQADLKKIGISATIKQQEFGDYLQFLGPPPNKDVDMYRLGWIGDFPDAFNFLELWTCGSGNNNSNFCDEAYDELVEQARNTPDDGDRFALYGQMESIMFGEDGALPVAPIYWYTYVALEKPTVRDSFAINLLDQIDLAQVRIKS